MTKRLHVATLVAPARKILSPEDIQFVADRITMSGGAIEKTATIDPRVTDIFFDGVFSRLAPHEDDREHRFDVIVQPAATRRKKILAADMESTIIEQEMLDELAQMIGIGPRIADITRRAMKGEMDFAAALTERVALLKGQPEGLLLSASRRITLAPGAQDLVTAVKRAGGKTVLVSGGFTCFAKKVAERVGFDGYFANELEIEKGFLTGRFKPPILDKFAKKILLEQVCRAYGAEVSESAAVGDGANDVPMLETCMHAGGLGVAYRAKPAVRETVANQINHSDLSALVYAQGLA